MTARKLIESLENLGNALDRLGEALEVPETNDLVVDGTVQRFEFVYELTWKTFKRALGHEGVETKTPRESIKEAFAARWIEDEARWIGMLDLRNRTSHTYLDEEIARDVYERIRDLYPELRRAYELLVGRYESLR
jgi:nucleotidyltransferase substrate binding protein (TIGR01987 family)